MALLDSAFADLNTAGPIPLPLTLPNGFLSVGATAAPSTTQGSFAALNRALAGKAGLELAYAIARSSAGTSPTPTSPGAPDVTALTRADSALTASALYNPSVIAPPIAGPFALDPYGVYHTFSTQSGDNTNPLNVWYPYLGPLYDLAADVDTANDLRWKNKFVPQPTPFQIPQYSVVALPMNYLPLESPSSPLPIVRAEELALVGAEIDLGLGNYPAAINLINTVHMQAGGFSTPLNIATTYTAVRDTLMKELRISTVLEGSADHLIAIRMWGMAAVSDTTWDATSGPDAVGVAAVTAATGAAPVDLHTIVAPPDQPELTGRNGTTPFPARKRVSMRAKSFAWLVAVVVMITAPSLARGQQIDTSYYAGMRWRLIGPYRSGNVYAVAGIPGNPYVYYAGMPEGGVWKTSDAGNTWNPIFDEIRVPTVGAVVVAPSDPNIVYVGTGDPAGWGFTPGNGVYKSTDAGKTWRHIGLEGTRFITGMIVDPRDPNIVLVGALGVGSHELGGTSNTNRGVYRSTNGGQTWSRVLYKDPYTGVFALTYDYTNPHSIYAALQRNTIGLTPAKRDSLSSLGAGIYRLTDEGATWTAVAGRGLPESGRGFAIALANGTEGRRVYAEPQSMGREAHGLYRSDDGGVTWSVGTPATASATGPIYTDPKNPDVVYLMGTLVYKSVDGGHRFASVKGSAGGDDPRDLWIDPTNPRRMLLGVDQGPTITVNGGETWTPWYDLPNGQFYRVSTDGHFPYRVCGAQQDSGTECVLSRSDYGEIRDNDWAPVGGFEDAMIVADPLNDRYVYTQGWYHVFRRFDRETGQVVVLYTPAPEDRFVNIPPVAFSPQDPHLLFTRPHSTFLPRTTPRAIGGMQVPT